MTLIIILLFVSLGVNEILWEEQYNQLEIEWCEDANDRTDMINDLLIELQSVAYGYEEIEPLDYYDCWVTIKDETQN